MNERQLRAMRRRQADKRSDFIAHTVLIAVVAGLMFWAINAALNQIDHRVCNTSSPAQYVQLHCNEVK